MLGRPLVPGELGPGCGGPGIVNLLLMAAPRLVFPSALTSLFCHGEIFSPLLRSKCSKQVLSSKGAMKIRSISSSRRKSLGPECHCCLWAREHSLLLPLPAPASAGEGLSNPSLGSVWNSEPQAASGIGPQSLHLLGHRSRP